MFFLFLHPSSLFLSESFSYLFLISLLIAFSASFLHSHFRKTNLHNTNTSFLFLSSKTNLHNTNISFLSYLFSPHIILHLSKKKKKKHTIFIAVPIRDNTFLAGLGWSSSRPNSVLLITSRDVPCPSPHWSGLKKSFFTQVQCGRSRASVVALSCHVHRKQGLFSYSLSRVPCRLLSVG